LRQRLPSTSRATIHQDASHVEMTPAMAAGVERKFWSYGDLVEAVS